MRITDKFLEIHFENSNDDHDDDDNIDSDSDYNKLRVFLHDYEMGQQLKYFNIK